MRGAWGIWGWRETREKREGMSGGGSYALQRLYDQSLSAHVLWAPLSCPESGTVTHATQCITKLLRINPGTEYTHMTTSRMHDLPEIGHTHTHTI